MNEKFSPSKILLVAAAIMSFAVAGCERRAADQTSGTSGASSSSSPGAAGGGTSGGATPGGAGGGTSGTGSK